MPDNKREEVRKLARFRDNVMRRAASECDEIVRSVEEQRRIASELNNGEADRVNNNQIEEQKQRIQAEYMRQSSLRKTEYRAALNRRREELRLGLFNEVSAELEAFGKTPEYTRWLLQKAENYRDMQITVRSCDLPLLIGFNTLADDHVTKLGGFKAQGVSRNADETFERLLQDQIKWFTENSKLELE